MVEAARRITGKPIPTHVTDRRPGDPAKLVASSSTAKKVLGWQPRSSLLDTLVESTWKVYARHFGL
jgi:UDP-glucose 4-epimerase